MLKETSILGRKIPLTPCDRDQLKGLSVGERLSYAFYIGSYQDVQILFVEPKKGKPTPRACDITSRKWSELFSMPVVWLLQNGPFYERQRLMDKGVYFVISDKFAHLPMLVALERPSTRKEATRLSAVGQYLLLYHLQVNSIEGLTAQEIHPLVPYSYESVALGLTCLADLGLCEKEKVGLRSKAVHFGCVGKDLWDKASAFLINPVEQRVFCDELKTGKEHPICGVNALSHYTMLNPDKERTIAVVSREYREIKANDVLTNPNVFDGNILIEVWKYPPVAKLGETPVWVDRLSLALSLKDDDDPRVEGEVERMINEMKW